mmetsp:Transcript_3238/g.10711  ORF Transcript_3238/g.10711 Transcript_3238/m.10711 type:complete len:207 (-) Transcript_3238:691-1311(-)
MPRPQTAGYLRCSRSCCTWHCCFYHPRRSAPSPAAAGLPRRPATRRRGSAARRAASIARVRGQPGSRGACSWLGGASAALTSARAARSPRRRRTARGAPAAPRRSSPLRQRSSASARRRSEPPSLALPQSRTRWSPSATRAGAPSPLCRCARTARGSSGLLGWTGPRAASARSRGVESRPAPSRCRARTRVASLCRAWRTRPTASS